MLRERINSLREKIKQFLVDVVTKERSPRKLALSCSMGIYIAFSPFIGLHTAMIFVSSWLFRLNLPVVFASGYLVNNPWTLVPVFSSGYATGYLILHTLLGLQTRDINPWWMTKINLFLETIVGTPHVCFWSFMVGANVLGVVLAFILYPLLKQVFCRLVSDQVARDTPSGPVA